MRTIDSTGIVPSGTDRFEAGVGWQSSRHRAHHILIRGHSPAPCLTVCGEPTCAIRRFRDTDEGVIPDDAHRLVRIQRVPIPQLAAVGPPAASFSRERDRAGRVTTGADRGKPFCADDSHRRKGSRPRSITELTGGIETPTPGFAGGSQRTARQLADADCREYLAAGDRRRCIMRSGGPVAELALAIVAPAHRLTCRRNGARVAITGAEVDETMISAHARGHERSRAVAITQRARRTRSPTPRGAMRVER